MPDHDDVKPDWTISHNLEDRIGATIEERADAVGGAQPTRRGALPTEQGPTKSIGNGDTPVAPEEGAGSRR